MMSEKDIKKVIVEKLKKMGFQVLSTEIKEGFKKPAVFVNVYPSSVTLYGTDMEEVSDTVEIKYFPSTETTEMCADAAQKIRHAFMYTPLKVNDRYFTIQSMETDIDNCILYVYFDVKYTQMTPDNEEYEQMEELVLGGI